jgi:hypothetical protein
MFNIIVSFIILSLLTIYFAKTPTSKFNVFFVSLITDFLIQLFCDYTINYIDYIIILVIITTIVDILKRIIYNESDVYKDNT